MQENKSEPKKEVVIIDPSLELAAGHWPGVKNPPWKLNDIALMDHAEVKTWMEASAKSLEPEREVPVASGEIKMPEGEPIEVDINAVKVKTENTEYITFLARPHSLKWDNVEKP